MVRLRLYDILALLPPKTYEGTSPSPTPVSCFCGRSSVLQCSQFKKSENFPSSGSFNALLRELVAEFTLTDNSANTTTSLLRSLCHYDDSVLMGSWLQETDHKSIEDQVPKMISYILSLKCEILTGKSGCVGLSSSKDRYNNLVCTDPF